MLTLTRATTSTVPAPVQRGRTLKDLSQKIESDGVGWCLRAQASGPVKQAVPRGAVLTFQFYDAHGNILDSPLSGFGYSDVLKSRFSYVSVEPATGTGVLLRPLLPPPGSARLECQLRLWQAPEQLQLRCELAAETHEFVLADLAGFEATDPLGAERVAWRWLDLHAKERQYLLEIQAFAWRIGATRLLAKASRLLEAAPDVRGYMRNHSRYALAALQELEDWLPDLSGSVSHIGLAHRVAHLAPTTDGDAGILAHAQFGRGIRPWVLIPCEYADCPPSGAPYSIHNDGGVEIVAFSALTPQARLTVPRNDLLRFDVLLAEQWVRRARIGLLHAHVGRSGYDLALRALALGKRCGLPVVMNWHSPLEPYAVADAMSPPLGSEWAEMAYRQQVRCAQRADAVIVSDPWQAWQLQKAGLPSSHVFLVPQFSSSQHENATASSRPHGKTQWTALVDVRGVESERIATLAAALPTAIGHKNVQLRVIGPSSATAMVEQALSAAGLQSRLGPSLGAQEAKSSSVQADVVILLCPQPGEKQREWLSGLPFLAWPGTLILAESTPQSEYLVRQAGFGLTFDPSSPTSFAEAFAALSPAHPNAARLRSNLRSMIATHADTDAITASIDRVYHHALCSLG